MAHQMVVPMAIFGVVFYWTYEFDDSGLSVTDWYLTLFNHGVIVLLLLVDMLIS